MWNLDCKVISELNNVAIAFVKFPGWGRLIFFDTEERQVYQGGFLTVASLPILDNCWKVTFDLKPVEDTPWANVQTMILADSTPCCNVMLTGSRAILEKHNNFPPLKAVNHQLQFGEWNRIQITHEEGEGGNFFVSLSVEEEELAKLDVGILEQDEFTDVQILLSSAGHHSPAFTTRRLLVVEKL